MISRLLFPHLVAPDYAWSLMTKNENFNYPLSSHEQRNLKRKAFKTGSTQNLDSSSIEFELKFNLGKRSHQAK